jgi:signal peptide peptidase SppA
MTDYPRLAARVFNVPLLATPEAATTVADYLAARIAGEARAFSGSDRERDPADGLYALDDDGIATIDVHGELVNRGDWMDALSGVTSYKTISNALDAAAKDTRVRGIVLDLDSPGGEAAGAMETAAKVRAVSQQKRVVAYVDSLAASAAYALASGAHEIVATPSATIGSIGVVWLHMDRSKALADKGMRPTLLHAGAYKVDGNAMQPLPDDARARIQAQIDQVYGLFVETVGKHRPKLGADGARKTEAGIFLGQSAVEAGLADRVGGLDALKSSFPRKSLWSLKMPEEPLHTQAALDAAVTNAVAASRRDSEAATAAAVTAARTAERERIRSILDGESAKGRQTLARHFALSTDMSPESATAALAAAAPEAAAPAGRMSQVPAVDIRPGATQRDADPQAEIDAGWSSIITAQGVAARPRA